ncbi:MAG TPA: lysophospholipid acyltransferase family protein [Gemmatimonadaceae bacterium]
MAAARLPELGSEIPRSGGPVSRAVGRWMLRAMAWSIDGAIPNVRKFVIIVAPHTSNWDFVVGIAAKWALGLRVVFLGKDTLFRFPLGAAMRALGGVPVDRSASHDVVQGIVQEFARRERMILALAPEGTRKRVQRWRTGFYHAAHGARVPILPVALNWGKRAIEIGSLFTTTGDVERDVRELQDRFSDVSGKTAKA